MEIPKGNRVLFDRPTIIAFFFALALHAIFVVLSGAFLHSPHPQTTVMQFSIVEDKPIPKKRLNHPNQNDIHFHEKSHQETKKPTPKLKHKLKIHKTKLDKHKKRLFPKPLSSDPRPKSAAETKTVPPQNPLSKRPPDKEMAQPQRPQAFGASSTSVGKDLHSSTAIPIGSTLNVSPGQNRDSQQKGTLTKSSQRTSSTDQQKIIKKPKLLKEFRISYPERAVNLGIEGTVHLKIWVNQEGRVKKAKIIKGPGFGLNKAAKRALLSGKFLFRPAITAGKQAAPFWMDYFYTFRISD